MERVSSRQRLVSWNSFDATNWNGDVSDTDDGSFLSSDYETCYEFRTSGHPSPSPMLATFSFPDEATSWGGEGGMTRDLSMLSLSSTSNYINTATTSNSKKRDRSSMKERSSNNNNDMKRTSSSHSLTVKKSISFCSIDEDGKPQPAVVPFDPSCELKKLRCRIPSVSPDTKFFAKYMGRNCEIESSDMKIATNEKNVYVEKIANLRWTDIPNDVKIHIFSFLLAPEVRALSATNKEHRNLCRSEHLWVELCSRIWPIFKDVQSKKKHNFCSVAFRDDFSVPDCLSRLRGRKTVTEGKSLLLETSPISLNILYAMSQNHPYTIDEKFLTTKRNNVSTMTDEQTYEFRSYEMIASSKSYPQSHRASVIQFTSSVGAGDRCIRSDVAFPHVQQSNCHRWSAAGLFELLLRGKGAFASCSSSSTGSLQGIMCRRQPLFGINTLRPFVSPMVSNIQYANQKKDKDGVRIPKRIELNLTPRLVAYYEITLYNRDKTQEPPEMDDTATSTPQNNEYNPECVAIGLSTNEFNIADKMPGWDKSSYGFHGDDGGIFHANGDMIRRFGPKFGSGDTIGCGIDYANQGIFFTLNGKFLGYAWTNVDLNKTLYPTVGVDTNCPIQMNFGGYPFAFDLQPFVDQHTPLIECALSCHL